MGQRSVDWLEVAPGEVPFCDRSSEACIDVVSWSVVFNKCNSRNPKWFVFLFTHGAYCCFHSRHESRLINSLSCTFRVRRPFEDSDILHELFGKRQAEHYVMWPRDSPRLVKVAILEEAQEMLRNQGRIGPRATECIKSSSLMCRFRCGVFVYGPARDHQSLHRAPGR